ncbi:hypothetical protein GOODEAATRI_005866 [Goodea atripinnis]|uniref:Uncharacterized protein n=1 Tax=Goodea atripinnis TaxID=208336 RepID=A0ABV0PL75_9TELE
MSIERALHSREGKSLRDEEVLQTLPVGTTASFYFNDLGPQLTWGTVFLAECVGPLILYLMFYFRLPFIYSPKYDFTTSKHWVVHLACMCHSFHYIKRILETLFVHRISHGTMPLRNIFKMAVWAKGKHRSYLKEFRDYPTLRSSILPFIL